MSPDFWWELYMTKLVQMYTCTRICFSPFILRTCLLINLYGTVTIIHELTIVYDVYLP